MTIICPGLGCGEAAEELTDGTIRCTRTGRRYPKPSPGQDTRKEGKR